MTQLKIEKSLPDMNDLKHVKAALLWITDILKKYQIPFQISGGLAARAYGAKRPIADIDIDIPNDKFEILKNVFSRFIIYGPAYFKSDKWNVLLMTLNYNGQEIDLSGVYQTKVFNNETDSWVELDDDLSSAVICDVLGLRLPVIPKDSLIAYKKILSRPEDIMDINEISKMKIELLDEKITAIGVDAIIDFYKTMAIDKLQLPGLNAFVTGADSPSLNVVLDTRKNEGFSSEIVDAVANFFNNHQVTWGWFITAIAAADNIEKCGFEFLYQSPGMYFDLSNEFQEIQDDIIIKELHDDLKEWIEPLLEGFPSESGEDDDVYRSLNAKLLLNGEKKLRHFTVYVNNEPACSGTLFLSDNSVMLHNLATKNKFRNMGLGTALTLYMMKEAKKLGYKHCFLDSSDEGFSLYSKVGFKVYCVTSVYKKTPF